MIEHELDATMTRTGRVRRQQFYPTIRRNAVPPSKRGDMPFTPPPVRSTDGSSK